MARVPRAYEPEPGVRRCGNTFEKNLTVTGEIYGRGGFGAERKHIVPKIQAIPRGTWWSYQSRAEAQFIERIERAMDRVDAALTEHQDDLSSGQRRSIEHLLDIARNNLDLVPLLYAYWDGTGEHPQTGTRTPSEWPLPQGDRIYEYVGECEGVDGQWVVDRELVGQNIEPVRSYYCPDADVRARRAVDRDAIRKLVLNAARAVRCAEWGLWRSILYRASYEAWQDEYGDVGGFAPTAPGEPPRPPLGGGAGGFEGGTGEPPVPPEDLPDLDRPREMIFVPPEPEPPDFAGPPEVPIPTPPEDPDLGDPAAPPPFPPEPTDDSKLPSEEKKSRAALPLAVAGGVLALLALSSR